MASLLLVEWTVGNHCYLLKRLSAESTESPIVTSYCRMDECIPT